MKNRILTLALSMSILLVSVPFSMTPYVNATSVNGTWQEAYTELLKNPENQREWYGDGYDFYVDNEFALRDIDGNGIPELVLLGQMPQSDESYHWVDIYTFNKGLQSMDDRLLLQYGYVSISENPEFPGLFPANDASGFASYYITIKNGQFDCTLISSLFEEFVYGNAGAPVINEWENGELSILEAYSINDANIAKVINGFTSTSQSAIKVVLNGKQLQFDQPPIIEQGRTLVPLRAIFEALGAKVDWENSTQTVTAVKGDISITLQIGSNTLYKNGKGIHLDVPAKIVNGRTLVPARAVAESFGAEVSWDQDTQTVTIRAS
jgi:hypothetical protein